MLNIAATPRPNAPARRADSLPPRLDLRPDRRTSRRFTLACAFGLILAALTPPVGFIVYPDALRLIGPSASAYGLVGALLAIPALIGLAAARLGLSRVAYRLRSRADREHAAAISRVFVGAILFAFAIGLAESGPAGASPSACLAIAAFGLAVSWGALLHVMARPGATRLRRYIGLVFDAALISAFLHFGGGPAAAVYPLYLLVLCQAGFYLGIGALGAAATASTFGFATAAATTPYWQQQPLLAAGLGMALVIVAGLVGGLLRVTERTRAQAAAAASARNRWLAVLGRTLKSPRALPHPRPELSRAGKDAIELPAAARAFLSEINDLLDLSAIDAGDFTVGTETFDMHLLLNRVAAELRAEAEAKGLRLAVRIDPRLPFQLRGSRQLLGRILGNVGVYAIENCPAGAVRIAALSTAMQKKRLRLTISVRFSAPAPDIETAAARFAADPLGERTGIEPNGRGAVALTLASRLAGLLGGEFKNDAGAGSQRHLSAILPFEIEDSGAEIGLDLDQRPMLIVTEDSHFAHDLAEPLTAWQADARWIGGFSPALAYLPRLETTERPILIVDGRNQALSALSFVHRAKSACPLAPYILFVADAAQAAGLGDLAEDEFDCLLPAPVDDDLLGNALHALPLHGDRPPPIRRIGGKTPEPARVEPPEPVESPMPTDAEDASRGRVTPITAHPRFAPDPADCLDPAALRSLQALGGGNDGFLPEVVDSFRIEAGQVVERMQRALAASDAAGFAQAAQALRRASAIIGGARLCEILEPLRQIDANELQERGAVQLRRIGAELAAVETALDALLRPAEAQSR